MHWSTVDILDIQQDQVNSFGKSFNSLILLLGIKEAMMIISTYIAKSIDQSFRCWGVMKPPSGGMPELNCPSVAKQNLD